MGRDRDLERLDAAVRRWIIELDLGSAIEDCYASFEPAPFASGSIAQVYRATFRGQGEAEARAYHQNAVLGAAVSFAQAEGIIVAPETAHAVPKHTTNTVSTNRSR